MRNAFCNALVALAQKQKFTFLTGDLGFMALEPLQAALGPRFINAGVAEQNMVGVAAGLASAGEPCWAYSIAPFIYARPFEQIRNDICLHDLPVKLIGNGGGYGYGVMGATHHALEDYGALTALQNLRAYIPAFADDLAPIITALAASPHPAYLRLGRCEKPPGFALPAYAPWRQLLSGAAGVLAVCGPNAGPLLAAFLPLPEANRPALWAVSELPLSTIPPEFLHQVEATGALFVLEEHVAQGSFGMMLAHHLLTAGAAPRRFHHFHARGYPSKTYGSQSFHRAESSLDPATVLAKIQNILA